MAAELWLPMWHFSSATATCTLLTGFSSIILFSKSVLNRRTCLVTSDAPNVEMTGATETLAAMLAPPAWAIFMSRCCSKFFKRSSSTS